MPEDLRGRGLLEVLRVQGLDIPTCLLGLRKEYGKVVYRDYPYSLLRT